MKGLFITFEGPDGAGKSTQIGLLRRRLEFEEVREPGSTELGERIRELLLHGDHLAPEAQMYLFMAARAELLDRRIRPALAAGRVVVADRYHDSTMAYQGARGVAVTWPPTFPRPDLTVLLKLDGATAPGRLAGRTLDRIESEPAEFHARVMAEYLKLAAAEPGRFLVIDGRQPADDLAERVWDRVSLLLQPIRP